MSRIGALISTLLIALVVRVDGDLVKKNEDLKDIIGEFEDMGAKVSESLSAVDDTISETSTMAEEAKSAEETTDILYDCFNIASKIPIGIAKVFKAPATFFKLANKGAKKLEPFLNKGSKTLGKSGGIVALLDGAVLSTPSFISPFSALVDEIAPLVIAPYTCMKRVDPNGTATKTIGAMIDTVERGIDEVKSAMEALVAALKPLLEKIANTIDPIASTLKKVGSTLKIITDIASPFDGFAEIMTEKISIPWITTYGRGVGRSPDCRSGMELRAGLCYPKCRSGYKGVGPVCWQSCGGFGRDDGAFCKKNKGYGRGAGRSPCTGCSGCSGCGWRGCSGCSGCSSCSTKHCRSSEQKNGALCYPKCRSGYVNHGCCLCSPRCPSGMKDIGISCTKKSYGRGAGHLPKACRQGEELWGLLCYPKCREGYKPRACCVCEKPIGIEFTLRDIVDGIGKVLETLYEIPIVGDLLKLVDKAIEGLLKPIMDAIPGMPDFSLPSLNVNFGLGTLPFGRIHADITNMVLKNVEKIKNIGTEILQALPSSLPKDCPEVVAPLTAMVAAMVGAKTTSAASSAAPKSGDIYAPVMNMYNRGRKCRRLAPGTVLQTAVHRTTLNSISKLMQGDDNDHKMSEKKNKRKGDSRNEILVKTKLDKTMLVHADLDGCPLEQQESSVSRGRALLKHDLQFAITQSAKLISGDKRSFQGLAKGDVAGYFIQRLDLNIDGSRLLQSVECIWTVQMKDVGFPHVVPFHKKKTGGGGAVGGGGAAASMDVLWSADGHEADLGISGFYFVKKDDPILKIGDFDEKWASGCSSHEFRKMCPKTSGCRKTGKMIVPRSEVAAPDGKNTVKEAHSTSYSWNSFIRDSYDAMRHDKVDLAKAQSILTTNQDPDKLLPAYRWHAFEIDLREAGKPEELSRTFVTVGPTKAGEPSNKDALAARVKGAHLKAREKTDWALTVLQFIRAYPGDKKIPSAIGRLLRVFFGIPVTFDGYSGTAAYGDETLPAGMAHVFQRTSLETRKYPLYPALMNDRMMKLRLKELISGLQKVHNWLMGARGPIIHRQTFEGSSTRALGYTTSSNVGYGQMWVDFFHKSFKDVPPAGSERMYLETAETIIHELTHATMATEDQSQYGFVSIAAHFSEQSRFFSHSPRFLHHRMVTLPKNSSPRLCFLINMRIQCADRPENCGQ